MWVPVLVVELVVVRCGQRTVPWVSQQWQKAIFICGLGAANMYTVEGINASCLGGSHLQLQRVPSLQHLDQALLHLLPALHLQNVP